MNNRRNFIKKALATAGVAAISSTGFSINQIPETFNNELLSEKELDFINRFKTWVENCTQLVNKEKEESRWLKNNPGIMDIAEEAKEWMPDAQKHMGNSEFRKQFLVISNHLTDMIQDNSASQLS